MAPHRAELPALGLWDMTPPTLGGWFRKVLARVEREPSVARLFTDDYLRALYGLGPDTERWAAEPAAGRFR